MRYTVYINKPVYRKKTEYRYFILEINDLFYRYTGIQYCITVGNPVVCILDLKYPTPNINQNFIQQTFFKASS